MMNNEIKDLNSPGGQCCDAHYLLPNDSVALANIFNSEGLNASWMKARNEMESFNIPDFTGGVNPGDRRAIYYLIRYFKPTSVLEIGTHIGASTIHIASALHHNQSEDHTRSILRSVDIRDVNSMSNKPWLHFGTEKSPLEMIESLRYDTFVEFITDTSCHYLENSIDTFDFIFLDGDHSGSTVYKEVLLALKKLNPNGVILLHDFFPEGAPLWSDNSFILGPFRAVKRCIAEGTAMSVLPLGNLPWPTKLNSNITSLALLLGKI